MGGAEGFLTTPSGGHVGPKVRCFTATPRSSTPAWRRSSPGLRGGTRGFGPVCAEMASHSAARSQSGTRRPDVQPWQTVPDKVTGHVALAALTLAT